MEYPKSTQNTVKRGAKKAHYDRATIYNILDATEICYVAFILDNKPFVQPINFGRIGDKIYLHGSHQNRMTAAIIDSGEVCLNVTLLDGMKLTKSAFHHSVNYRSVVAFGKTREITDNTKKMEALKAIINHFVPDRWEHCRPPNEKELKATRVTEITIESASAKVATAPPTDNKEDYELNYWAGTIPVKTALGIPVNAPYIDEAIEIPQHVIDFIK